MPFSGFLLHNHLRINHPVAAASYLVPMEIPESTWEQTSVAQQKGSGNSDGTNADENQDLCTVMGVDVTFR